MIQFFKDLAEWLIMDPYLRRKYGHGCEWPGTTRKRYARELVMARSIFDKNRAGLPLTPEEQALSDRIDQNRRHDTLSPDQGRFEGR